MQSAKILKEYIKIFETSNLRRQNWKYFVKISRIFYFAVRFVTEQRKEKKRKNIKVSSEIIDLVL